MFGGATLFVGARVTTAGTVSHVLTYGGRRRGLHFLAGESSPDSLAGRFDVCESGGWRPPSLTEAVGLLRDGNAATLGAFAPVAGERFPGLTSGGTIALIADPDVHAEQGGALEGDAAVALDLQSDVVDSSASDYYRAVLLLPDSLALYSAGRVDGNRGARLVCVRAATTEYAGAGHLSEVSFAAAGRTLFSDSVSLQALAREGSFYAVTVVAGRPQYRTDAAQFDSASAELAGRCSGGLWFFAGRREGGAFDVSLSVERGERYDDGAWGCGGFAGGVCFDGFACAFDADGSCGGVLSGADGDGWAGAAAGWEFGESLSG